MSNAYEKSVPVKSVRKGHLHCFLQNVSDGNCVHGSTTVQYDMGVNRERTPLSMSKVFDSVRNTCLFVNENNKKNIL